MSYCANCGTEYRIGQNFCESCGRKLGSSASTLPPTHYDEHLASTIDTALARTDERKRKRRNAVGGSNESLELYIGCIGVIAMFHGLSLIVGGAMTKLLDGPIGLLMLAGILLGISFKVVFDMRLGYSFTRSLVETLLIGALTYGLIIGVFWYLNTAIVHSGKPLLTLPGISTPTPKP